MPANDYQVGGAHYKKGPVQHWDLSIMYRWDPFQYQITKYVMRWKDKYRGNPVKQLEDLKKARHFLDKYIESVEEFGVQLFEQYPMPPGTQLIGKPPTSAELAYRPPEEREASPKEILEAHAKRMAAVDRAAADIGRSPRKPDGWVGFTYEGGNAVSDYYRCKSCRIHFTVVRGQDPNPLHDCRENAALRASWVDDTKVDMGGPVLGAVLGNAPEDHPAWPTGGGESGGAGASGPWGPGGQDSNAHGDFSGSDSSAGSSE